MVVTFIVPTARIPIGGSATLYQYANALRRRGHEVHLFHADSSRALGRPDERMNSVEDISWFTFEEGINHNVPDQPGGHLPEMDVRLAGDTHRREASRTDSPFPEADFIFASHDLIPEHAGLPVVSVQGYGMVGREVEDLLYRSRCPKLCVARWLVEVGLSKGLSDEELVYVPNGIDHRKYRRTRPLADRPMRASMYYNSHPKKGATYGLDALDRARKQIPGFEVLVFGNSPPAHALPPGFVFHQDPAQDLIVDEIYNGSRLFVSPSIAEGFGFTAVEAMACGAAAVVTANGGSDDYAVHGDNALVSDPTDVDTMVENIVSLLSDEPARIRLARRGAQAAQHFDWGLTAGILERFFEAYQADPDAYRGSGR